MTDNPHAPVLLVDDDIPLLRSTQFMLELAGISPVATISDSRQVLARLSDAPTQLILLDLTMPHISGLDLLPQIRKEHPNTSIIVLSATQELATAIECMKHGADDYLTKPIEREQLISRVKKVLAMHGLQSQVDKLSSQLLTGQLDQEEVFADIVTQSPKMIRIFQYMESIASSKEPVLITGETGVGKDLIAQALHRLSGNDRPLVIENVAGLDDTVFSDTLFGHVRGAFTGADSDRLGLAAKAGKGTLVLDEIGDLTPVSQIKLLRFLQERSYTPLGSDIPRAFHARILVTTHRDLEQAIDQGSFRQDLFYRLAYHKVHVPPLRKRREDIPVLLAHFIRQVAQTLHYNIPVPPSNLADLLASYSFPGNVRELRAMATDAAARYKRSGPLPLEPFLVAVRDRAAHCEMVPEHNASTVQSSSLHIEIPLEAPLPTLKEGLKQMETYLVKKALERASHNQSRAAALLGLSRQAFYKRFRTK